MACQLPGICALVNESSYKRDSIRHCTIRHSQPITDVNFKCFYRDNVSSDRRKANSDQATYLGTDSFTLPTYKSDCNTCFATQKALSSHTRTCPKVKQTISQVIRETRAECDFQDDVSNTGPALEPDRGHRLSNENVLAVGGFNEAPEFIVNLIETSNEIEVESYHQPSPRPETIAPRLQAIEGGTVVEVGDEQHSGTREAARKHPTTNVGVASRAKDWTRQMDDNNL